MVHIHGVLERVLSTKNCYQVVHGALVCWLIVCCSSWLPSATSCVVSTPSSLFTSSILGRLDAGGVADWLSLSWDIFGRISSGGFWKLEATCPWRADERSSAGRPDVSSVPPFWPSKAPSPESSPLCVSLDPFASLFSASLLAEDGTPLPFSNAEVNSSMVSRTLGSSLSVVESK
jgi:hypothetical protein